MELQSAGPWTKKSSFMVVGCLWYHHTMYPPCCFCNFHLVVDETSSLLWYGTIPYQSDARTTTVGERRNPSRSFFYGRTPKRKSPPPCRLTAWAVVRMIASVVFFLFLLLPLDPLVPCGLRTCVPTTTASRPARGAWRRCRLWERSHSCQWVWW